MGHQEGMLGELLKRFSRGVDGGVKLGHSVKEYTGRGDRLLGHLFDKQLAFARDPALRKVACCSRRAGKSVTLAACLGKYAEDYPGALCIYICTTGDHAKNIMWPALRLLDERYSLGWKFNNNTKHVTTHGGSIIALAGADKEDRIEQFRGLAPHLVCIDESASFRTHIEMLIEEVIEPSLRDFSAPLLLAGTPGRLPKGYFYRAAAGASPSWSRHHWTSLDNSEFPLWAGKEDWRTRAESDLQAVLVEKGWTWDTPRFQREYLGRWVRDDSRMLYRYDPGRNLVTSLPEGRAWQFALGVDLGYGGTAFVVWAWALDDPYAYVVWAEKHRHMELSKVAQRGNELIEIFQPMKARVIDEGGLGKTINHHFASRFGFHAEPAQKSDKLGNIEAFNDDLMCGLLKVVAKVGGALVAEWEQLEVDEDGAEMRGSDNHCADAALYAWRRCRHFLTAPARPPKRGEPGFEEWHEEQLWQSLSTQGKEESVWGGPPGAEFCKGDHHVSETMSPDWGDIG